MARSCQECFKDKGFIMKFVELIVIIVYWIIYAQIFFDASYIDMFYHLSTVFTYGTLSFFWPVLAMFVIYILEDFPDHKYELIICITAAIVAFLSGIFLLVAFYVDSSEYDNTDYQKQYYEPYLREGERPPRRGSGDAQFFISGPSESNCIMSAIFAFALGAVYIIDAVINGTC